MIYGWISNFWVKFGSHNEFIPEFDGILLNQRKKSLKYCSKIQFGGHRNFFGGIQASEEENRAIGLIGHLKKGLQR